MRWHARKHTYTEMYGRWKICTYAYHICLYACVLYIYMRVLSYIYVNTYRHISNNMTSWCVQTWNSPKHSDFDEKNISFQTKIQGIFPTAESMADVVYSSNIFKFSCSMFFSPFVWDLYDWCGFIWVQYGFTWILLLKISPWSCQRKVYPDSLTLRKVRLLQRFFCAL